MTLSDIKKQALVAALCEHPDAQKYWETAFPGYSRSSLDRLLHKPENRLKKEDLFIQGDDGKSFLDQEGFWKNFSKVSEIIAKNHEHFTRADFLRNINKNNWRTLLQSAQQTKGFLHIFKPEPWAGHFEDMQDVFSSFTFMERKEIFPKSQGNMDLDLKRAIFALEGKPIPEDSLSKVGITTLEFHNCFRNNFGLDFDDLKDKLANAGDYLRKEYMLLPDDAGDTVFFFSNTWKYYPEIMAELIAHGEQFEIKDFMREIGGRESILDKAVDHRSLDKVFTPAFWIDRLDDMQTLWRHVPDTAKVSAMTQEKFDLAYATAETETYKNMVDFAHIKSKIDLLSQLNHCATQDHKPVLAIGMSNFWDHAPQINAQLAQNNERLTLDDLRRKSGQADETILIKGVKLGHFQTIVDIGKNNNEHLLVSDFLTADKNGVSVLKIMTQRRELDKVFNPDLWMNRLTEMRELWSHVDAAQRNQVDISGVEFKIKQEILNARANDNLRLPFRQKRTP